MVIGIKGIIPIPKMTETMNKRLITNRKMSTILSVSSAKDRRLMVFAGLNTGLSASSGRPADLKKAFISMSFLARA